MTLPISVDLRPQVDFVEDQGSLGICNPFAKLKALQILYERDGVTLNLSEFYLYYYARLAANALGKEGSSPELANAVLKTKGCCLDVSWPYDVSKVEVQPPLELDAEAERYRITSSATMNWAYGDPLEWVKKHLAGGKPVTLMMHINGDFKTAAGDCKDWRKTTWTIGQTDEAAHEVVGIGYDDRVQMLLFQNSWGPGWGDGGFFGMSYAYFMNSRVASLTDCITGFGGALHPAPFTPPEEVLEWYWEVYRRDVTDPNDEGVQYWSKNPEGKRKFLQIYLENVTQTINDLLQQTSPP
ncbi:MAG: C1 family peptidase [Sterolibacterium sp.]